MKIAIVGFGYWGEIIFNSLNKLGDWVDKVYVVDINEGKKRKAKKYQLDFFRRLEGVLDKVEAVIVASDESSHFRLAKKCLLKKRHTLVTKPLATNFHQAQELVKIARRNNLVLMVDNTFIFDTSFLNLSQKIKKGQIGNLLRIDSFRFSSNIFKPSTNVLVDLLPHDLSIFNFLFDIKNCKIININTQRLLNRYFDNAFITLKFGGIITNSFLSWTAPSARREMVFYGSKGVCLWQKRDKETDEIKIFDYSQDKKINLKKELVIGDKKETLKNVLGNFFESIFKHKEPLTSGQRVLPEVKILEKVLKSYPK